MSVQKTIDQERPNGLFFACVAVLLALPFAYALRQHLTYDNPMDFRYFWGVGRLWAAGESPYAPEFTGMMTDLFRAEGLDHLLVNIFHNWVYSPHSWAPTRFLAAFEFYTAFRIWTFLNLALIYAGTYMVATLMLDFTRRWHWGIFAVLLLFTVTSIGGVTSMTVGQPSGIVYFSAAAFAYGAIRNRTGFVIAALVLLTMKASIGLPFVAVALAIPRLRMAVVIAGVISVLLLVPAVLIDGVLPLIQGYLRGVQAYAAFEPNAPFSMTGLRLAAYYLVGANMSGLVMALLASLVAATLAWWGERSGRPREVTIVAALAATLFLIPLHLYDLMLVSILAIAAVRPWFAMILVPVLVGLFRVNRLSQGLGIDEPSYSFGGSLLATVFLAILFLAALGLFWKEKARG